jgi:hypothetical protein
LVIIKEKLLALLRKVNPFAFIDIIHNSRCRGFVFIQQIPDNTKKKMAEFTEKTNGAVGRAINCLHH